MTNIEGGTGGNQAENVERNDIGTKFLINLLQSGGVPKDMDEVLTRLKDVENRGVTNIKDENTGKVVKLSRMMNSLANYRDGDELAYLAEETPPGFIPTLRSWGIFDAPATPETEGRRQFSGELMQETVAQSFPDPVTFLKSFNKVQFTAGEAVALGDERGTVDGADLAGAIASLREEIAAKNITTQEQLEAHRRFNHLPVLMQVELLSYF